MRLAFSFVLVSALIAASMGCAVSEFDIFAPGTASIMVRHHGGEHFKVQDYTHFDKYFDKMASGELTLATLTADDLPAPVKWDLGEPGMSQAAVGDGTNWYSLIYFTSYDYTDVTNPTPSLQNPSLHYNLEIANPYSSGSAFQPWDYARNGVNVIGNHGYVTTSPGGAWSASTFYLTNCYANASRSCSFDSAPNRVFNFVDYYGDSAPDYSPNIWVQSCFYRSYTNFDGWGFEFLDISGNSTIRDADGNTIDSVQDLVSHALNNPTGLDLRVSLERVSHPEIGSLDLARPLEVTLHDLSGRTTLNVNENIDLVDQLHRFLERVGYQEGEGLDLSGMTLDFGDWNVTLPDNYVAVDFKMDAMKKGIEEVSRLNARGERDFSRDRVRVR